MIIFGHPIHRKYTRLIYKFFISVISVIVFLLLVGCSKLEFDPTTTSLRYIFLQDSKWKQ
jgi:hypothetical protein|tara:strand:+ start:601 stop:780 length:180 start_codon:yes stop_codon:yes gene_type:complete